VETFAEIEDFRWKSITRYFCLWPPPRPFTVITPRLLRPLQAILPNVKLRSGFTFDKSSKYETDFVRVPGLYALYRRIALY